MAPRGIQSAQRRRQRILLGTNGNVHAEQQFVVAFGEYGDPIIQLAAGIIARRSEPDSAGVSFVASLCRFDFPDRAQNLLCGRAQFLGGFLRIQDLVCFRLQLVQLLARIAMGRAQCGRPGRASRGIKLTDGLPIAAVPGGQARNDLKHTAGLQQDLLVFPGMGAYGFFRRTVAVLDLDHTHGPHGIPGFQSLLQGVGLTADGNIQIKGYIRHFYRTDGQAVDALLPGVVARRNKQDLVVVLRTLQLSRRLLQSLDRFRHALGSLALRIALGGLRGGLRSGKDRRELTLGIAVGLVDGRPLKLLRDRIDALQRQVNALIGTGESDGDPDPVAGRDVYRLCFAGG